MQKPNWLEDYVVAGATLADDYVYEDLPDKTPLKDLIMNDEELEQLASELAFVGMGTLFENTQELHMMTYKRQCIHRINQNGSMR